MFFRRERPRVLGVGERLDLLGSLGFRVARSGAAARVTRGDCAVDLTDAGGELRSATRAGMSMGGEIAMLVDGGYQKFFTAASGAKRPATAGDLNALHDFEEDLKEALGQESLYNESLGTVSTFYLYDRVKDRDRGVPKRVWE
jgi:hypothetical protein